MQKNCEGGSLWCAPASLWCLVEKILDCFGIAHYCRVVRVSLCPMSAGGHTPLFCIFVPNSVFVEKQRMVWPVAENNKLVAPLFPVEIAPLERDAILNIPASVAIADLHDPYSVGLLVVTIMFRLNRGDILYIFGKKLFCICDCVPFSSGERFPDEHFRWQQSQNDFCLRIRLL